MSSSAAVIAPRSFKLPNHLAIHRPTSTVAQEPDLIGILCFDLTNEPLGWTPAAPQLLHPCSTSLCNSLVSQTQNYNSNKSPRQWAAHSRQLDAHQGQQPLSMLMAPSLALASISSSSLASIDVAARASLQASIPTLATSPAHAWAACIPAAETSLPAGSSQSQSSQQQSTESGKSSQSRSRSSADKDQPRFPPWKKLGLGPPSFGARNTTSSTDNPDAAEAGPGSLAVESSGGRRRVYRSRSGVDPGARAWEGFEIVEERKTGNHHLRALVQSYLLPQGFPESVAPQYASYMGWRGVQYFFGGGISVFTTKSLLGALGMGGKLQGEAAAAINWVIKDGAGRLGRFLFARWGRELDCELKQFRLAGDLLMEAGAALELATIYAPPAFLPLACTANLAKNLAAVAASSTRAPIYRTFALQNNLADITAKGESVANLADILGTIFGIVLSKMKTATLPTFAFLSAGYLVASRMEVDSVELPYMNRARLAYSAAKYLTHGSVPSVAEANHNEPLLPWGNHNQQRIELGACVDEACASGPEDLRFAAGLFKDQRYLITYRPDTGKVCVVLREGATSQDCLKASLTAHLFLHLHDGKPLACGLPGSATHGSHPPTHAFNLGVGSKGGKDQGHQQQAASPAASSGGSGGPFSGLHFTNPFGSKPKAGAVDDVSWRTLMSRTRGLVDGMHNDFVQQAEKRGWNLKQTMLNPKEVRVLRLKVTPLHV